METKEMRNGDNSYDLIAREYQETTQDATNVYSHDPMFDKLLGDVRGASILDLACGDGYFSRRLSEKGARVVGVDLSTEQIRLANAAENKQVKHISYLVGDARAIPTVEQFDIVVAKFLLHYARVPEDLRRMASEIYTHLKPGGRMVALINNPDNPIGGDIKYDFITRSDGVLREGGQIHVDLYKKGKLVVSFDNYYWKKSTYLTALQAAGFSDVQWIRPTISKEGVEKFGEEFWRGYADNPNHVFIVARK